MSHHPSRSDPTHLQSGLTKALDQLGRTRGSSATPAPSANILSPTPQRGGLDKQIAKMNAISANRGDGRELRIGSSQYNSPGSQAQSQMQSPNSAGGVSLNQRSPYRPYGGHDTTSDQHSGGGPSGTSSNALSEFSQYFQSRLIDLRKSLNMPGLTVHIQQELGARINSIGQEFNGRQRPVQLAFETARDEQARIQAQLDQVEGRILAANLDRDRAQMQVTEWRLKKQQSAERLNKIIQDLRKVNDDLMKKVEDQEDQLNDKRGVWTEKNPVGSDVRRTNTLDPFNSPSGMKGQSGQKIIFSGMMGGSMGSIGSLAHNTNGGSMTGSAAGSIKGSFAQSNAPTVSTSLNTPYSAAFNNSSFNNPVHGSVPQITQTAVESPPINDTPIGGRLRRRGAMPAGKPVDHSQALTTTTRESIINSLASLPTNTEPGSPDFMPSRALVLRGSNMSVSNMSVSLHDPCSKYEALISEFYGVIESWCATFLSIPNLAGDQAVSKASPEIWTFMMECIAPSSRQDSHNHVMLLLQNPKTRFLFAVRLAISYFMKEALTIHEFETFSPETEATIVQCKKALSARGLANEVRQTIVDRQTKSIKEMMDHESFEGFYNARLLHHTKGLRDVLGPLLNLHVPRSEAGKGLGNLVAKALDLSLSLHTSSLTFQIYFPETSVKFNPQIMVSRDQDTTMTPQMQLSQLRLKLVITPVVTLRDDHGTTIRVKNLHKSQVLTIN